MNYRRRYFQRIDFAYVAIRILFSKALDDSGISTKRIHRPRPKATFVCKRHYHQVGSRCPEYSFPKSLRWSKQG